jgi:Glycosyltransferase family 9 (heptosyltransferase)
MGWGDELVAAGQAQRLFEADPSTPVAIYGLDGQVRWHPIWDGNPAIATPEAVANGARVQRLVSGPNCRPYIVYPFTTDTGWTFDRTFRCRDYPARLYLTDAERAVGERVRETYGPYVLIEPYTKHDNFRWPLERWQALVASCPDLTFVQHTHPYSERVPGAHPEPATFRETCALIALADVYVRSESGLCHAAGAMGIPQVTLFGGCMDATVMGGYPGQTCLVDRGQGSPCGSWNPCDHCREAMDRITVADVVNALREHLQQREAA